MEYSGNTTRFFHVDHRFTPRVRTDVSGNANQTWDGLPFGEAWQSTGGGSDQHRLTGYIRDSESDNDHGRREVLLQSKGKVARRRSLEGDSGSPQSLNRFSYVLNDPVNHSDEDGRMPVLVVEQRCTTVRNGPPEPGPTSGNSGATIGAQ